MEVIRSKGEGLLDQRFATLVKHVLLFDRLSNLIRKKVFLIKDAPHVLYKAPRSAPVPCLEGSLKGTSFPITPGSSLPGILPAPLSAFPIMPDD